MKNIAMFVALAALVSVAGCRQKAEEPATRPAEQAYVRPHAGVGDATPPARPVIRPVEEAQPPERPTTRPAVDRPARPTTRPAEQTVTQSVYTGELVGGMMAIGGETTGYVLRTGRQQIEVDLAAATDNPEQFTGRQVRVKGEIIDRDYVERGPTPVLVAREIELE